MRLIAANIGEGLEIRNGEVSVELKETRHPW